MNPPQSRSFLYPILTGAALFFLTGCGGVEPPATVSPAPKPLYTTVNKQLKPKAKAGTPTKETATKDAPEDPSAPDESVSRAAAGLQKVLGKNDARAEPSDLPPGFTPLPANPKARTKQPPQAPRKPVVYPAPPPATDPVETLQPVPPAPSGPDTSTGSTTDAILFPAAPPAAPAPQPVAVAPAPVFVQSKAAPIPAAQWPTTFAMPTAALCSRVESFGKFTSLPPGSILPGRATPVLLYTEFEGFQHRTTAGLPAPAMIEADGKEGDTDWVVEIEQEVTLWGSDGLQKLHLDAQSARDVAKRRRRDHFLVQRLTIPSLPPGQYTLKITARDRANYGYTIETNLPVTIKSGH